MPDVLMPQMGESIAEGTIVRWIKKLGESVDRDEPLFEISTDKVDAEIPSPAAGVLSEIRVKEGETVAVNTVVAVIGGAGQAATPPPASAQPVASAPPPAAAAPPREQPPAPRLESKPAAPPAPARPAPQATPPAASADDEHKDEGRRQQSSPLVRKIAREHHVDIAQIQGSGLGGRVTKQDILGYIDGHTADAPAAPAPQPAARQPEPAHTPAFKAGENVEVVPMSVMRRKIAEHMVLSVRTSPHVFSVYEVNYAHIARLRDEKKGEYERAGVKLTYTAFIAKAVADALRAFPFVNASIDGNNIVYRKDINVGIAVALDWGLIVPVIRHADEKNMLGISRAIQDLAGRARAKQLKPEEVQGGTFTVTNPGVFGALFGLPIISQPQVAILGVGAIEKRVVVENDAIAIRPMGCISLGYDHRLIDGADAGRFLAYLKKYLETFEPALM